MKLKLCLGAIATLLSVNAIAQTCVTTQTASHQDGQFIDRKDGTLLDVTTNLLWSKCNLGETYNASTDTCDGTALKYQNWSDALVATQDTTLTTIAGQPGFRASKHQRTELNCGLPLYSTSDQPNLLPNDDQ